MNAELIVSFSNSSLDLSVKNRPAPSFQFFPLYLLLPIVSPSAFWLASEVHLALPVFFHLVHRRKRPDPQGLQLGTAMALTADSAILLSILW